MPIKKNKISYTLDLTDEIQKVKPSKRKAVTKQIGDLLVDSIVGYLHENKSPVKNGSFKKDLSKEYAKKTGKKLSDLHLKGDMLSSIRVDNFKDRITLKITDTKQKNKAYNHNTRKDSTNKLPERDFIPNEDKSNKNEFKKRIMNDVYRIIDDASED